MEGGPDAAVVKLSGSPGMPVGSVNMSSSSSTSSVDMQSASAVDMMFGSVGIPSFSQSGKAPDIPSAVEGIHDVLPSASLDASVPLPSGDIDVSVPSTSLFPPPDYAEMWSGSVDTTSMDIPGMVFAMSSVGGEVSDDLRSSSGDDWGLPEPDVEFNSDGGVFLGEGLAGGVTGDAAATTAIGVGSSGKAADKPEGEVRVC